MYPVMSCSITNWLETACFGSVECVTVHFICLPTDTPYCTPLFCSLRLRSLCFIQFSMPQLSKSPRIHPSTVPEPYCWCKRAGEWDCSFACLRESRLTPWHCTITKCDWKFTSLLIRYRARTVSIYIQDNFSAYHKFISSFSEGGLC